MSTQATLLGRLQTDLRVGNNNRIWSEATQVLALNDAYTYIQSEGNYGRPENQESSTITTASGTQEYSLPSDFRIVDTVIYNNTKLNKTTKAYVEVISNSGDTSIPNYYYIYGNKIGLYPTPNGVYTIKLLYGKGLPTISSSQDSEFPVDFDSAISAYAAYLLNMQVPGRQEIAQIYLIKYEGIMSGLKLSYLYQDINSTFKYQKTGYQYRDDAIYN